MINDLPDRSAAVKRAGDDISKEEQEVRASEEFHRTGEEEDKDDV